MQRTLVIICVIGLIMEVTQVMNVTMKEPIL